MRTLFSTRPRRENGSTLVVAVFVVALLAVFIGLALDYTANTARVSSRNADLTRAQAIANGALEAAYKRWQLYMSTNQGGDVGIYGTATLLSNNVTNSTANSLSTLIQSAISGTGFTLSSLTITPVDRADNAVSTHVTSGTTRTYSSGPMTNVPGWVANTFTFCCSAVVTNATGNMTVSVSRFFQLSQASLFQAMLFFQNDLELHPGPAMTLYGLVHTNANMYAAAGSGGSLTFNSNVSFHGSQSTLNPASNYKYKDASGYVEGVTSTLYAQESGNWNSYNAPAYSTSRNGQLSNVQALNPLGTDASTAIDNANANASGTHEIIERPVPVSSVDPSASTTLADPTAFKANRVYNNAGIRIFINHSAAYTSAAGVTSKVHVYVRDSTNSENSVEIIPATGSAPANLANTVAAAITPGTTSTASTGDIYEFREGRWISVDTVDMSALSPAVTASGYNTQTIYISDVTNADANGNTGNSDAIRLTKGATLAGPLAVVTDGAVYVQGDYNTGGTYDPVSGTLLTQPVSNTGADPTQYTVAGKTQVGATVMGDAVMILSNAWKDSNSNQSISSRNATPTTFNAAIVSGQVLTTSSAASGGAHNFPRFLEDWGGDNFTYHGSMCEMYGSTHFTGNYGKGNVYAAPNRRWFFDTNYLSSPPPGGLQSTTYTRGRWVRNANS